MKYCALLLVLAEMVAVTNSFTMTSYNRFKLSSLAEKISEPMTSDPNFEAHLANFLKVGSAEERPTPELAADLRKRFKSIEGITRHADERHIQVSSHPRFDRRRTQSCEGIAIVEQRTRCRIRRISRRARRNSREIR